MRILILTNLFPTTAIPWGGSFIKSRVDALGAEGHSADVLALVPRLPRWVDALMRGVRRSGVAKEGSLEPPFVPVTVSMGTAEYVLAWRGRFPHRAVERAAEQVAGQVDLKEYDVVIAHGMYLVPAGSVAKAAVGPGNYSVVSHGSDVNLLMPHRAPEYASTFDDAKAAVFVSSALRDVAVRHGMGRTNATVIPNGVDLGRFQLRRRLEGRRRFGWTEESNVVAFVGNLVEVKGADRLPDLARSIGRLAPGTVLAVAGDGPLMAELRASAPPNLIFMGRLSPDEIACLLAASDVLVLPSRSEGWPTVIMEAFACGTRVVGTAVGGIPEALDGRGTVVSNGEGLVERLSISVVTALERHGGPDPDALRAVAEAHSWETVAGAELDAAL